MIWVASDAAIGNAAAPHPAAATFSPAGGEKENAAPVSDKSDGREKSEAVPHVPSPACRKKVPAGGIGAGLILGDYRRRLPRIPRTSARPSEEATVRATDFIAASATVSRW
ncbi:hypothetical protein NN6n1_19400 [Shinella zoogloeoides]